VTVFGIDRIALWYRLRDSNDQNLITSAGKCVKQFLERSEKQTSDILTRALTADPGDRSQHHNNIIILSHTTIIVVPTDCVFFRSYPQWSCRTNRIYSSLEILLACARRVLIRRTGARPPTVSPAIWSSVHCCGASTALTHNPSSCRIV